MIKYIFTLVFIMAITTSLYAQRLLKGQKGFEATIGVISDKKPLHDHFYIQAGLTINGKNGSYGLWALEYSKKVHEFANYKIPVEAYTAEGGYSFPLLRDWGKTFSVNLGMTGVVGYEVFNRSEAVLSNGAIIQNADSFIYGAGVRLSFETYLIDHLVFLLQGKAKAIWGTSVENLRPAAGVGFRYIF